MLLKGPCSHLCMIHYELCIRNISSIIFRNTKFRLYGKSWILFFFSSALWKCDASRNGRSVRIILKFVIEHDVIHVISRNKNSSLFLSVVFSLLLNKLNSPHMCFYSTKNYSTLRYSVTLSECLWITRKTRINVFSLLIVVSRSGTNNCTDFLTNSYVCKELILYISVPFSAL